MNYSEGQNLPIRYRLLPPMAGGCGVRVGEAGGGVCVVQRASHHNGACKGIIVVPWGISVTMQRYVVKYKLHAAARLQCNCATFTTALCLLCDLLGLRGRPSLDTLRGIAAELRSLKSEGGALINVPPLPAVRV